MRVRALKIGDQKYIGYYGLVRRKPGDVFDIAKPEHFSDKWMEKVEDETVKTPAPGEATPEELGYQMDKKPTTLLDTDSKRGLGRPKKIR